MASQEAALSHTLRRQLIVQFVGEAGIDEGGLTQDFCESSSNGLSPWMLSDVKPLLPTDENFFRRMSQFRGKADPGLVWKEYQVDRVRRPVQIGQRVIYLADGSQGVVVEVKPGKVTEELGLTRSPGESGGWEGPAGGAGGLIRQRTLQRTRSRPRVNAGQPPQTGLCGR